MRGSDGAPYVLDTAAKTVWRIDLAKKTATAVARAGQKVSGVTVADPTFLAVGGLDVLILDSKNVLWRWRPTNSSGKGTLRKIPVVDSASWGNDIRAIATFVANFDAGFYKLYIVDPSEQNIMVLSPANDGSGYPVPPTGRLPTDRPVDGITDLLIDGDIFVAEDGAVARVIPATGWDGEAPGRRPPAPELSLRLAVLPEQVRRLLEPSRRGDLRVQFDQRSARRVQQGERLVHRPIPARGRRGALVGPARDGRAARLRSDLAPDDVVDLVHRPAHHHPRGRDRDRDAVARVIRGGLLGALSGRDDQGHRQAVSGAAVR